MGFINKLIKKVFFGCLIIFSFFLFSNGIKIQAADTNCSIALKDNDKYLVLNLQSGWNDLGVTITCDGVVQNNVNVVINGGTPVVTTNDGLGISDNYVRSAGFYKIQYYLSTNTEVTITRHVRVLPDNINSVKNLWLGESEKVNSTGDDTFTRIIDTENGYLAIGNFGTSGYVVKYNLRGEFLWMQEYKEDAGIEENDPSKLELTDIIKSESNASIYYIAGQATDSTGVTKGFVKPIQVNTGGSTGINEAYGTRVDLQDMVQVNRIVKSSSYIFAVGYKIHTDSTRIGVIAKLNINGATLDNVAYSTNTITSQYNSLIATTDATPTIVAVGNTNIEGRNDAVGGLITVCTVDTFSCENKDPQLYLNDNLLSATITRFNDIVRYDDNYLVVGESRIDRVTIGGTSNSSGVEDALIVLFNSSFEKVEAKLLGSNASDSFVSIKKINDTSFFAVGNRATVGYYVIINYNGITSTIEENTIGNTNTIVKDVFIQTYSSSSETQYIFVGETQATNIEGIYNITSGNIDAMFAILDITEFANYENIDILQGAIICSDNTSTSCTGNTLKEDYFLRYGDKLVSFPENLTISSDAINVYNTFHGFNNNQGIEFKIGRIITINENYVAPDLTTIEMGIGKWYLYSREQVVVSSSSDRKELWSEYYYPVDNNITKSDGVTYYVFNNATRTFTVDSSSRWYTLNNYIKLAQEPQNSTVAFQNIEKIHDFALLQEFTRIAFVNERFSSGSIVPFPGEIAALSLQQYYYVYYIDLSLGTGTCSSSSGNLVGNCTASTGYAFANLTTIKTIVNSILSRYNDFVTQRDDNYDPYGGIATAVTDEYKEEMATIQYVQNRVINLSANLQLVVEFSPINNYEFGTASTIVNSGVAQVTFGNITDATHREEGKYTVRYCYNYGESTVSCGAPATFVIDYTAPIINYKLRSSEEPGSVIETNTIASPAKLTTNILIENIKDIDPYAYTIIDGMKYYLKCNVGESNNLCNIDLREKVQKSFEYDIDDPDKIYEMHVYDRAGNRIDFYFKIGTERPTITTVSATGNENFTLVITMGSRGEDRYFVNRNEIDSLAVVYTRSEDCLNCADASVLKTKIEEYIDALTYINNLELERIKNDPDYTPTSLTYVIELTFSIAILNESGNIIGGGVTIPRVAYNSEDGSYELTGENETFMVSRGLYEFVLGDSFYNTDNAYGGIGLERAELDIYINNDRNYDEVDAISTGVTKIPVTAEEIGSAQDSTVFEAIEPNTYNFVNTLQTSVMNDFRSTMFFTNQYVYIKFKANSFGAVSISEATSLNHYNNYRISAADRLNCLFTIYGESVVTIPDCVNKIEIANIKNGTEEVKSALNAKGIYVVGVTDEYYYLAFTVDGTYMINSEVIVEVTNDDEGSTNQWVSIPVNYSFTIDSKTPVVNFEIECEGTTCKGEQGEFILTDFVYDDANKIRYNIGNNNMKLLLNTDLITATNTSVQNRLLVVTIGGETYNAYDYAVEQGNPSGDYILFTESGVYEITFTDAGNNQIVYRFVIDKENPTFDSISDINGKVFNEYQQYIEARLTISERSFLTRNNGETMLIVQYWINNEVETKIVSVKNENGSCVINEGSGNVSGGHNCQLVDNGGITGLEFSFVIDINKTERLSGINELRVRLTDYFGNESNIESRSFYFDNQQSYLYFDSTYTPVTVFGEEPTNEERERMLSIDADASLFDFRCDSSDTLISGKVNCSDSPTLIGVNNNVVMQAYEAARVAYNNYRLNGGTYELITNGTQLFYNDTTSAIYKRVYLRYNSQTLLESDINSTREIYVKTNYVQVGNNEKIDPNTDYYYGEGTVKSLVSIKDMYTNSDYSNYTTCDEDDKKCELYRMYIDNGSFTNTDYYTWDDNYYTAIADADRDSIDAGNFANYYYTTATSYEIDEGKILPALTLANTCVMMQDGNCNVISEGRIKLKSSDNSIVYYNYMNEIISDRPSVSSITVVDANGSTTRQAVIDSRIWQIATQVTNIGIEEEARFRFGIASNLGRPIIFRAIDGAGNYSINYLETVIAIKDEIRPTISNVSSVSYEIDNSGTTTTLENYIKQDVYYKVADKNDISCTALTEYYRYDITLPGYVQVDCETMKNDELNTQYYVSVEVYTPVEDGLTKDIGTIYYIANIGDLEGNYITSENLIVEFSEPIYKILCSYYVGGTDRESEERECSFTSTEYDYIEDKKQFHFVYEGEGSYYVNYRIEVYDFSNNSTVINYLFIDRESPDIAFNGSVNDQEQIEVNYVDANSTDTQYNQNYKDSGFRNEVSSLDSVNDRINSLGVANLVTNTLTYTVRYYKYNYNVTFNNYVRAADGTFNSIANNQAKAANQTYYVLIKQGDYVLKGNSGTCVNGYCYVVDEYNYYPSLLENNNYWTLLEADVNITNDTVGVYKVEYYVMDQSSNTSETIIKTIYIVDTQMPTLSVNGLLTEELYGYHKEAVIRFDNENEYGFYQYTCTNASYVCTLPSEIFASVSGDTRMSELSDTNLTVTAAGVYKIYFHDLGSYVDSTVCSDVNNCETSTNAVRTLKYNYREYQFVIDLTSPALDIMAMVDQNTNKLYYEASLTQEEYIYCVRGAIGDVLVFGEQSVNCTNLLTGTPSTEVNADGTVSKYIIRNANNEIIYEETFKKLAINEAKYFYNIYYYKNGDDFIEYPVGATYNEDNVYIISSIKLYFREDGQYLIKAADRAGNEAGRITTNNAKEGESIIEIDNTAPTYNKEQNGATGVNYWYSVPSRVINSQNIDFVRGFNGAPTYDIRTSGLNNTFFYAFATRSEAIAYLQTIYSNHITAQSDNNCQVEVVVGKNEEEEDITELRDGFNYSYYSPSSQSMVSTGCLANTAEKTGKIQAQEIVDDHLNQMVYKTFSGNLLFGDPVISQIACDSSVSGDCVNSKDMYKYVYLKIENGAKSIAETCSESDTVTCIKVNVKIVNYTASLTSHFEIKGMNATDTQTMNVYSKAKNASTSSTSYTSSFDVPLNANTYYIFEELDTPIRYTNYKISGRIEHYNTTYYAIYVDNNNYLDVFTGVENTENVITIQENNIINSDGISTQNINYSSNYYLILKNVSNADFINDYEIHELWQGETLLEVHSYLRVILRAGVEEEYINLNDPNYFVKNGNEYYYKILINKERVTELEFIDRAGNVTRVEISHSQVAPAINLAYDGEGASQTVNLEIRNTNLTAVQTSSIRVAFSKDGTNYSESLASNIRTALLCLAEPIGYTSSCANIDGRGSYSVTIENKEELYGFFKVSLRDTHGNTNEVIFIYNPIDLTAEYTTSDLKFIDSGMDEENVRMITNQTLMLEWDNLINYIILYKETDGVLVEVCNTINMSSNNGNCGSDSNNRVESSTEQGRYVSSTLYYTDEGYYQANIINRQSVTINNICVNDGTVQDECKAIKTHTSNICSWENNADYCAEALNVVESTVYRLNVGSNTRYTRFEIDKTAPNYSESNFEIRLAKGSDVFKNNGEYVNAEVLVKWEDNFVDLVYTCRYVDEGVNETCAGNHTGFAVTEKQYLFSVSNRLSTEYTFHFVDYAGNTTVNNALTFTIKVVLPEIKLFEVDENGDITNVEVVNEGRTRRNTELVCSEDGKVVDCSLYNIRLYRYVGNGYQEIYIPNITLVSENSDSTYRYIVAIKNVTTGYVYENLSVEHIFTIDKQAPTISIEGNMHEPWGIYTGEVRVLVDTNGVGTIYNNCVITGEDVGGNSIYTCDETPFVEEFNANYTLSETGIYRIIARDEIGNVTTGSQVRYVHIDNQNPEITITAKTTYVDYMLSENGYTNASVVLVESKDNNEGSYFLYRTRAEDGTYGEWITHTSSSLQISEEGFYEVKPVDTVGNEGVERHFIIYRQTPRYYVYVNNRVNTINDILTEDAFVIWDEPSSELQAPIVKVTLNGQAYQKRTLITETGEYVFVFTDLAGNSTTHKITINKNDHICLDNVSLIPNKQFLFPSNAIRFSGGEGYEFKENDVVIFATPTNYYGGSAACGANILCYKSLDANSYIVIDRNTAAYINSNKNVEITMPQEYINKINDLGGYVYAIIVDRDVAKRDLGFEIGENFFTKDPLGWSLIIIAGIAFIYVSLKVVVFKKKVKVLK